MGNVIKIERPLEKELEIIGGKLQKLIDEKKQLEEKRSSILAAIEKNRSASDSYYADELDEIEREIRKVDRYIKFENHAEWKKSERLERYQRQDVRTK